MGSISSKFTVEVVHTNGVRQFLTVGLSQIKSKYKELKDKYPSINLESLKYVVFMYTIEHVKQLNINYSISRINIETVKR